MKHQIDDVDDNNTYFLMYGGRYNLDVGSDWITGDIIARRSGASAAEGISNPVLAVCPGELGTQQSEIQGVAVQVNLAGSQVASSE